MLYSLLTWSSFLFVHYAKGVSISINNAGFETTSGFTKVPIPANTYYYKEGTIIAGWTLYDPYNVASEWSLGVQNPTGGDVFHGASAPEGLAVGYVEQEENKKRGDGELGIQQTLSATVTAHTTYTLSVWVGNPYDNCFSTGSSDGKENCYEYPGFPGYRVQLLAGSTILVEDNNSQSIADGSLKKITLTYAASGSDANIGKSLKIRLVNKNLDIDGVEVSFDDVQLTAVTTTTTTSTTSTTTTTTTTAKPTTTTTTSSTAKATTTSTTVAPVTTSTTTTTSSTAASTTSTAATSSSTSSTVATETSTTTSTSTTRKETEDGNDEDGEFNSDADDAVGKTAGTLNMNTLIAIVAVAGTLCFLCFCIACILYKIRKVDEEETGSEANQGETGAQAKVEMKVKVDGNETVERTVERDKIHKWLKFDVQLPQYTDLLLENGYDSMRAIMAIKDRAELKEIGVAILGHQSLLLSEITKLRENTAGDEAMDGDGFATTEVVYGNRGQGAPPPVPSFIQREIMYEREQEQQVFGVYNHPFAQHGAHLAQTDAIQRMIQQQQQQMVVMHHQMQQGIAQVVEEEQVFEGGPMAEIDPSSLDSQEFFQRHHNLAMETRY